MGKNFRWEEYLLEQTRKEIKILESDIEKLELQIASKASEKATALARMQARLFLEKMFSPYIDGVCSVMGESPEDGLRNLIENNTTFGTIAQENPQAVEHFLSQPEVKVILTIASPLRDVSEEWIKDKMDILFEVMVEVRPGLASIIVKTPGGKEWFYDSLTGLREILFF